MRAAAPKDGSGQPFESSHVQFNCQLLTPEAHGYLEQHEEGMIAQIMESFARLWLADDGRPRVDDPRPTEQPLSDRRSRRRRRARAKLWASIDEFLRQERRVTRD